MVKTHPSLASAVKEYEVPSYAVLWLGFDVIDPASGGSIENEISNNGFSSVVTQLIDKVAKTNTKEKYFKNCISIK